MSASRENGEVRESKLPRVALRANMVCDTAVPSAFGGSTADKFIPVLKPSYANALFKLFMHESTMRKNVPHFLIYSKYAEIRRGP